MMWMSESEIVKSYTHAANPREQIGIIAQLNCCSRRSIISILLSNNVPVKMPTHKQRKINGKRTPRCDKDVLKYQEEFRNAMNILLRQYGVPRLSNIVGVEGNLLTGYADGTRRPGTVTLERILSGLDLTREQLFELGREKSKGGI